MEKVVRIFPSKLHSGAIALLQKASPHDMPRLIGAIESGKEVLFTVLNGDEEVIGVYVLRRESEEMVIVAGAADFDDGYSAMQTCMPLIMGQVIAAKCDSVRCHVSRPGMQRMLRQWGFQKSESRPNEIILRAVLNGRIV